MSPITSYESTPAKESGSKPSLNESERTSPAPLQTIPDRFAGPTRNRLSQFQYKAKYGNGTVMSACFTIYINLERFNDSKKWRLLGSTYIIEGETVKEFRERVASRFAYGGHAPGVEFSFAFVKSTRTRDDWNMNLLHTNHCSETSNAGEQVFDMTALAQNGGPSPICLCMETVVDKSN